MVNVQPEGVTAEAAMFELTLRNAEQADRAFEDVVIEGMRRGLPPELLTRLEELWSATRVIAGEVVAIGKIIIGEIVAFFKANPGLSAGMALGAAVGMLIGSVPFIGPLLAPISTLLGSVYGGGVGAMAQRGVTSASPVAVASELARKFFEMFVAILNAVSKHWAIR